MTTGILSPNGTLISGQAVAIDFAGERVEDMTAKSPAAMWIDVTDGAKQAGGGSRGGIMARLRKIFNEALEQSKKKPGAPAGGPSGGTPGPELDALVPVVTGQLPVAFQANRKMDIENALRLVQEFKLKAIILGGAEGWKIAPALAAAQVPVALSPNQDIPSFDALGTRLDNATLLRQAGVTVIFAGGDPGGERNLRFSAGNAVRNGMTWDDALKAMTLWPAQAFGLTDYGTLDVGKVGNVVVWSGDPFDFAYAAEKVIIRGKETSLRTRENELRDRYRTLPVDYYKP
ncbi:MAG: amidohydrolase family protein [Gemmatimonadota bacterium]